jgi:glyoxylase-like metal-dependent hydrolase (beta-lactamase superfamily II)
MLTVHRFTFNPIQENMYLLAAENGDCIVIDPGCYFDHERDSLDTFIKDQGLKPILLINTHCHLDHVFGNKHIHDTYGLELHVHPEEERMLQMAPASGLMYGIPFDNYTGTLNFIHPGEEISLGNEKLKILFTPGHSPGSLSFYAPDSGFVISGDALFNGSIGRTDLPFGSHETLLQSIQNELFTLPDNTIVYSGHGPETTIGYEKQHNPFLN